MPFTPAKKYEVKLRMALDGPAGAGKTFSALKVATELVGSQPGAIAVIDTEHGSASKYADEFTFDVQELEAPFHPEKYVRAIREAEAAGYKVLIIDSLSHAWAGAGGALEIKEATAKQRGYNDYTAWGPVTKLQNDLVETILGCDMHVIITMRSKMQYAMKEVTDSKGYKKTLVEKLGMAPVQRDGVEYEFDIVMDLDTEHTGYVTKTRCKPLTDAVIPLPGKDMVDVIKAWLAGEKPPERPKKVAVGSNGTNGAHGTNGTSTSASGSVTPKVEFWRKLRERLAELGADVTNPKEALKTLQTPWAAEVLHLMETEDFVAALKMDLSPGLLEPESA